MVLNDAFRRRKRLGDILKDKKRVTETELLALLANLEIIDRVNERLPEKEKFDWIGWYLSKRSRLVREYKRFYPEGRLLVRVRFSEAFMFACLFIAAWCFGLFAK